ncbi:MAG TPA: ABC transporter ATP-binding protein [Methylomirabilota bacterium]|nr:ABC transporter ATP-binding protein [Methylomirabilota bacterium]
MNGILALRDVRLDYAAGFTLDVPALDVLAGEVLVVIGPNGSGKSTLLRVLGLLERPARGRVLVDGRPADARHALAERRRMATVFQEPLLADTSVAANAALGLRFRGVPAADAARRASRWLERLGVGGLAARPARTLSGGEAQRVALTRALVLEPSVLLLDEPFASLDQPSRTALLADLGAVLREDRVTTVLVTHDRGEALALADRVAVIMRGRIQQVAAAGDVFQAPASEEVARFVGVETIVSGRVVGRAEGVTRVEIGGRTVEVAAPAEPGRSVSLAIRPEDVTLALPPERGGASSARNVLAGSIAHITVTDAGARVVVDCGFPLVATVTPRSLAQLRLAEGMPITAMFEASAPHLLPAVLDTPAAPGL